MTIFKTALYAFIPLILTVNAFAYDAPFTNTPPTIDGAANETQWSKASWMPIDQLILGDAPSDLDFTGRYKVMWNNNKLFLLAEIIDDVLIDTHADPLVQYWDDDTLEIFIDEDKSGGVHLDNYNAFAYHIALDNQVVDFSSEGKPKLFNDHATSVWKRSSESPNKIIWEVSIDVYSDKFSDIDNQAKPLTLHSGKQMGFMLAYCDSDGNNGREHFIGSHEIEPVNGDRNRGYIDASVFGLLSLVTGDDKK